MDYTSLICIFIRLCLVYVWCFIFDLLYIYVTILLLFSYKLLLVKISIVLHEFAFTTRIFIVVLRSYEKFG
jgi:hypothetical protein